MRNFLGLNKQLSQLMVMLLLIVSFVGYGEKSHYHHKRHNKNNKYYPVIDITNGVPAWVHDYSNVTISKPQDKGSYTISQDNVSHDGKIYRKSYGTSNENVNIITVKPKPNK